MIDAELIIYDPTLSNAATSVGISASIPIAITLAIADVREPDKRNSSFSKTLTLPGTKILNRLFEQIFDVTSSLNNFNPMLKTRCEYFVRGEKVFSGDIQLLKIRKRGHSPSIEIAYECSIVGRLANVFIDLGNSLLEDLDFSALNMPYNWQNMDSSNSANNPNGTGVGFVFPMIDYGQEGGNSISWYWQHLKPAIFELAYVNKIFTSIGKTFTSTFFGTQYYRNIIIPDVNEGAVKMTAAQINSVSFYAGKTALNTYTPSFAYVGGNTWIEQNANPQVVIQAPLPFTDDTNLPFYDGGGVYNTGTYYYTTPVNGNIKISTQCNFSIRVNAPATTTSMLIQNGTYQFKVDIVNANGNIIVASASTTTTANYTTFTNFSINVQLPSSYSLNNQIYYVRLTLDDPNNVATTFYNGGTPITAGTATFDVRHLATSWFSATSGDGVLPMNSGYTLAINQCIPRNVKQIDFLMSIIKSENLYMELDLTDSNNYIIEPRTDFFLTDASNTLDWTDKWDYQRETEVIPMGDLDFREYIFTYKSDGDKFNKLYKDAFGEVYGQEQILVDNNFIKSTKKNELIFAATPLAGNPFNNLVTPVLAQVNGTNVKPMTCTIRRLIWGGSLACNPYNMYYQNGYGTNTSYWYAGHVNNPYAPTIDLCWDNPKMLYYNYPGLTYTSNNLYERNWQRFIEQITNKNSKIVVMWMYLKASDIANFTFRKRIWINDSYYIVNKIFDYNPQEVQATKIEFLRLGFVTAPVAEIINIWDDGAGAISGLNYNMQLAPNTEPNNVATFSDGIVSGNDNINLGNESSIIGGEGNVIAPISYGN